VREPDRGFVQGVASAVHGTAVWSMCSEPLVLLRRWPQKEGLGGGFIPNAWRASITAAACELSGHVPAMRPPASVAIVLHCLHYCLSSGSTLRSTHAVYDAAVVRLATAVVLPLS
jgi:hypothetical protein